MGVVFAILMSVVTSLCAGPFQPQADSEEGFRRRYRVVMRENQPAMGPELYAQMSRAAERIKAITKTTVDDAFPGEKAEMTDLQALTREGASAKEREIARAVLVKLVASDVPGMMETVAKAERLDREMNDEVLLRQKLPGLGQARQLARFQSGRMTLLLEAKDFEKWLRVFGQTLRLGDQVAKEPTLISALVGIAIQAVALNSAQRALHSPAANDELLRGILAAITRHPPITISLALRGERILALDAVDYVYALGEEGMEHIGDLAGDNAPRRPAKRVIPDGQALGPGMPSYEDHVKLLNSAYDAMDRLARMPFRERAGAPELKVIEKASEKSILAKMLLPAIDKAMLSCDQLAADRMGTFVQAALERRHLNRGSYPASLAEMAADLGNVPPTDPYTGNALGYRLSVDKPFEGGRKYVLYAAGVDGVDDGGKVNFSDPYAANKSGASGVDFLLNRYTE